MSKKTTIYGIRTGDKFHYIGKTNNDVNAGGTINKSGLSYHYNKPAIRRVFAENKTAICEPLKIVPQDEWYDEKLHEVVAKHQDNHPLVNAQWMLDGKRGFWEGTGGYWQGKKRDANTLKMLSQSKYRKVCQYGLDGKLIKVWTSGKEVGQKVFGDYHVENGCGKTELYFVFRALTLKGRVRFDSLWFREAELLQYFNCIPIKLNLDAIRREEREKHHDSRVRGQENRTTIRRYTVQRFDKEGVLYMTYDNVWEAGYKLKMSRKSVERICGGKRRSIYDLRYGEKTVQPIATPVFPPYTIVPEPRVAKEEIISLKPAKQVKQRMSTRTRYEVLMYNEDQVVVTSYTNVVDCHEKTNLGIGTIRSLCMGNYSREQRQANSLPDLRYGKKVQTSTPFVSKLQRLLDEPPLHKPKKIRKVLIVDKPYKEINKINVVKPQVDDDDLWKSIDL